MLKSLRLVAILLLLSSAYTLKGDLNHYIETESGDNPTIIPICAASNKFSWSSILLTHNELGSEKEISHLSIYGVNDLGDPIDLVDQKIYLSHVDYSSFPNGNQTWNYLYVNPEANGYTMVYDGTIQYSEGWIDIDITDFNYNGTDNLVVHFESAHNLQNYSIKFRSRENIGTDVRAIRNGNDYSIPTTDGYEDYPRSIVDIRVYYNGEGPATPSIISPLSGSQNILTDTDLKFILDESGSTYDLFLGQSYDGLEKVVDGATAVSGENIYTSNDPYLSNSKYFWRVDLYDSDGVKTEGVVWSFTTETILAEFPFVEDFEDNGGGYTGGPFPPEGWDKNYGDYDGWIPHDDDSWSTSYNNAHSGVISAYVKPYNITLEEGDPFLKTPKFLLPENPRISFWWCDNDFVPSQNGGKTATNDVTYFEISSDNGETWVVLDSLSREEPMNEYEKSTSLLTSYANSSVYFRWRYMLLEGTSPKYTFIDDLEIENVEGQIGEITLLTDSLNFEPQYEGLTSKLPLIIENIGSIAVDITAIEINAPFILDFTGTIEPTEKDTLLVSFSPETEGEFSEILTIVNNGSVGEISVPVTGVAIPRITNFVEGFEGSTNIPEGWNDIVINEPGTTFESTIMVSPYEVDAHSGSNSIKMLIGYDIDAEMILTTPPLKNYQNSELKFWAKSGSDQNNKINLGFTSGDDHSTFESLQEIELSNDYQQFVITFDSVEAGDNIAFKFVNNGLQLQSLFIDDISFNPIELLPPLPTNLVAPLDGEENILLSSILEWELAERDPDGYKLFLGTDNPPSNILNGEVIGEETTLEYDISNLLEYNTEYFWQVVPYNEHGDASPIETWSFSTMEEVVITQFPWSENFDQYPNDFFPEIGGWSYETYSAYEFFTWNIFHNNENAPDMAHSAPAYIHYPTWLSYSSDSWLYSPAIMLEAGSEYTLAFYQRAPDTAGTDAIESAEVKFGDMPTLDAMSEEPLYYNSEITDRDWVLVTATINPTETKRYYFGFHVFSASQQDMYMLDDISITPSSSTNEMVPETFAVAQNYPNPFNPETTIGFSLPESGRVKMEIINYSGQVVRGLINSNYSQAGRYSVIWDGKDNFGNILSSGVYFYVTEFNGKKEIKKMILTK